MGTTSGGKVVALCVIALVAVLVLCGGIAAGCKSYNRYQHRADVKNEIAINHTKIKVAQQQAQINNAQVAATVAEAKKRVAEARGIRQAQDIISQTLTANYLTHEAIQAQKAIATSGKNNSLIYIPAGQNGVPLVQDISKGTARGNEQQALTP